MPESIGAHNRNRTDDLFLTKEVLYRLSYVSIFPRLGFLANLLFSGPTDPSFRPPVLGAGSGNRTRVISLEG